MKRAKTETIIDALRILADDIVSEDGVASAAIREAAERLQELHTTVERKCVWKRKQDYGHVYDGTCGVTWEFDEGAPRDNKTKYCPICGGLVTEALTCHT